MPRYDENLGSMQYDNLVNSSDVTLITAMRNLRGGQGILKRGTALALSSGSAGDKSLVIIGTAAAADETLTPNAILTDEVDTGSASVKSEVYITGHFNTNGVITKGDVEITADQIEDFRKVGIFFDTMMK
ncbi:hypothetical protein BVG16_16385 [Paenibacillus selenitireducens]|uniref:Head decoration protein n=1 Tax=Paenibacillus selenitireducens TaxID=1324314 RepID=A0A1T2XA85_9BACL|nr:hypothetical protein [Paenibacillus selenitireducens]OPA76748.1 hypothetical protein BVG16_16385 [Paenibacillus selenitireducens]